MAALIIAIFPQNSSRGNWEEQQDRTDPNSRFELARKPVWLLAFRQFGLPKWKHDFECGPFNRLGTSPNLCYIPGPDPPTNSAGGNREEQQDRTSNIIQFELGWNPHGSKGFSRLALRIGNLISNPDPSTTWVHLQGGAHLTFWLTPYCVLCHIFSLDAIPGCQF